MQCCFFKIKIDTCITTNYLLVIHLVTSHNEKSSTQEAPLRSQSESEKVTLFTWAAEGEGRAICCHNVQNSVYWMEREVFLNSHKSWVCECWAELSLSINSLNWSVCIVLVRKETIWLCVSRLCVSACLLDLASTVWGHCVVVRFCSAAQSSIPKLPPALFSLHH